jgi:hypothetical protein
MARVGMEFLLDQPPISPARGPPTDWGELVQIHDDRDVFQASPDELPAIDIHSLWAGRHQPADTRMRRSLRRGRKTDGSEGVPGPGAAHKNRPGWHQPGTGRRRHGLTRNSPDGKRWRMCHWPG